MNMNTRFAALMPLVLVGACAQMPDATQPAANAEAKASVPASAPVAAEVEKVVSAPKPAAAARSAEEFDTTSAEQKAAASAATEKAGEKRLGETVASLGDPTEPGFWIKTPLAKAGGSGRLENPATGKSATVKLIPLDGPATGGSQVSLAALRLLDAPLTDLTTLVVYAD